MGESAADVLASTGIEEDKREKYDEVIAKFESFFQVRQNVILERAKFNSRNQRADEPAEVYITELYRLVETCDYRPGIRDEMLRDRLVVGMKDKALAEQLEARKDGKPGGYLSSGSTHTLVRRDGSGAQEVRGGTYLRPSEGIERKCFEGGPSYPQSGRNPSTAIGRNTVQQARCQQWVLANPTGARIPIAYDIHHPVWEILFQQALLRRVVYSRTVSKKNEPSAGRPTRGALPHGRRHRLRCE